MIGEPLAKGEPLSKGEHTGSPLRVRFVSGAQWVIEEPPDKGEPLGKLIGRVYPKGHKSAA